MGEFCLHGLGPIEGHYTSMVEKNIVLTIQIVDPYAGLLIDGRRLHIGSPLVLLRTGLS